MARQKPFFYGWIIVGIAVGSMTLIYGIRHSFSVFFPSILNEFQWERGSTTIMLSLNLLFYGLLAPVAGSLGDRWNPKKVMLIGVVILGLATAGCAFAGKLWHFYLLFGVLMPIGSAFCGWPLLAPALTNWFARQRGLVMSLGMTGGGLSFSYGMFAEFVISRMGWRPAFFVLAGVMAALMLPLYIFVFHYRPGEMGLKAYGAREPAIAGSGAEETVIKNTAPVEWTLRRALKTHQLWLLALSWLLFWGIACYLVLAHQVKFAEDVGYSSAFAASVFGLFGFCMVVGQLSSSMSDWVGRETTVTLASILTIGGLVALTSVKDTSQPWLLYLYAIPFGLGAGLYSPAVVAGTADRFHGRYFGEIAGFLLTGMGLGGAIGPWLGGFIYDISGSYRVAFLLCIVALGVACINVWIAAPRKGFLIPKPRTG